MLQVQRGRNHSLGTAAQGGDRSAPRAGAECRVRRKHSAGPAAAVPARADADPVVAIRRGQDDARAQAAGAGRRRLPPFGFRDDPAAASQARSMASITISSAAPNSRRRRGAGAFLEWAEVFGNLYGTPIGRAWRRLLPRARCGLRHRLAGRAPARRARPADVVRVFILPPSRDALSQRLSARAADSPEVLARRLAGASEEMSHWAEYDYVIVNYDLDESLAALHRDPGGRTAEADAPSRTCRLRGATDERGLSGAGHLCDVPLRQPIERRARSPLPQAARTGGRNRRR